MKKIFVIEDDIYINNMLCELLQQHDYLPHAAFSGTEAILLLQSYSLSPNEKNLENKPFSENISFSENRMFSLVLLDLMLPGKTGIEVLAEIRKHHHIPVIVLTAVSDKESVTALLKAGANDYITKPFDNSELLARIEVQLRDSVPVKTKQLCFQALILDLEQFDGFINAKALGLSKREFEIMRLLMENPKKVFTKNNLYESVWNDEYLGDDNTINVHISKIRSKINKHTDDEYIQTVWGIGFKMNHQNK
ncbi:MAG: response regulator transcription factor [Lachnospiraceae bacterium]|jgi:DNA-binding response OmpR family regulator|nr:response regulator transcription factor [Lachnospiraceae bacterium]